MLTLDTMYDEVVLEKNKSDPKHLGIPNINFSLSTEDDKRERKYSKQRIDRGFDDTEMWSLANTIASFIIPRLKRFKQVNVGWPSNFKSDEDWKFTLGKMIKAFELVKRDNGSWVFTKEEQSELKEGLGLFSDNFLCLWD